MTDEFDAQLALARSAKESESRAAEAAAAEIRRQTSEASATALALLSEVYAAVSALRRAQALSVQRLLPALSAQRLGNPESDIALQLKKGFLSGARPAGWFVHNRTTPFWGQVMTVPFSGPVTLRSPAPPRSQMSLDAFARCGRFEWSTYDGTSGHVTHSSSAADDLRQVIRVIASHLADIGS